MDIIYLHIKFRVFDDDNSGTMDFTEYMMAINATSLNPPEDKLNWMFDVFDKDGGGTISSDEIKDLIMSENVNCSNCNNSTFFSGLFEMAGQEVEEEDLDAVSKDIMSTIDEDGDGDVTKVKNFRFL